MSDYIHKVKINKFFEGMFYENIQLYFGYAICC